MAVSEIVYTLLCLVPPGAALLGGGLLLLRSAPRLGGPAGVALVSLFILLALAATANRVAVELVAADRVGMKTYMTLSYGSRAATMVSAAVACVLCVRAAARAQRLD